VSGTLIPFGQGRAHGLDAGQLGRRGAEIDDLAALGLPVVPGLTVPMAYAATLSDPAVAKTAVARVENGATGWPGPGAHGLPPLFRLSVSAAVHLTGLPADLVCLGLSEQNLDRALAAAGTGPELLAAWSTTLRALGQHALGAPAGALDAAVLDHAEPRARTVALLEAIERYGERPLPSDPAEQVALAATAMLARWAAPRAVRARRAQGHGPELGLAMHLRAVRVLPREASWHGSATSRDPGTGEFRPQGAVFPGPCYGPPPSTGGAPLATVPGAASLVEPVLCILERHGRGAASVEYEIYNGQLTVLAARIEQRPGVRVAVCLAADLAAQEVISRPAALRAVPVAHVPELLHPQLRLTGAEPVFVRGLPASPGAASGAVVLTSERAVELAAVGTAVVLVAAETTPGDLPGLLAADAVITSGGGLASHAAVVARGLGRPAVCGAAELRLDPAAGTVTVNGTTLHEGDVVSVDGRGGVVYSGGVPLRPAEPPPVLTTLLGWADEIRRLGVRTNADTARETRAALRNGAEGIGLCRTEHQFLGDRLPLIRRVILAADEVAEQAALEALTQAQRADFTELLTAVGDRPVTVRLLDAPLHEFLPAPGQAEDAAQEELAEALREANPMLGVRGVRLALLHERLYPAQADALFSAWIEVAATGVRPRLEVMVPLVSLPEELAVAAGQIRRAAQQVAARTGITVPYRLGSMVETPRAALLAGALAEHAEFLSFGTNDLTQLTYGFSRDDVERRVLQPYVSRGLLPASPFATLDPDGVFALVEIAAQRARAVRPGIKLGLCGEHAGDPPSIELCDRAGLDYVSCSPQRVLVARLAAAQACAAREGEE